MVECTDDRGNKPCQPTESPCSSPCLCQRKLPADLIIAVGKNFSQVITLSNLPSWVGLTWGAELAVDEQAAKPANSDEILGARAYTHFAAGAPPESGDETASVVEKATGLGPEAVCVTPEN